MSKNNKLIDPKLYIKDIKYNMPELAKQLNSSTVKAITNAIDVTIVDTNGFIWFDCSKLHTIIRVKTKVDATYLVETIDKKYKRNYEDKNYILWSSLISIVAKRLESNPKNQYLQLVFNILDEVNKSNDIKMIQYKANQVREKSIKRLKKGRINKFKLVKDELTNKKLDKAKAEFSHIRSVTMHPELAEYIWNGLIVNKDTHDIITARAINDEDQLYELCFSNGWNIQWYNEYKLMVN